MKKYLFFLITIIYAAGILWVSFQPDSSGGGTSSGLRQAFMNFLHIPAYAGLAFLMALTVQGLRIKGQGLRSKEQGLRSKNQGVVLSFILHPSSLINPFSIIFIISTLYGILNEFIQASVPGRTFSIADMIRNAIGAGIGLWVVRKLFR